MVAISPSDIKKSPWIKDFFNFWYYSNSTVRDINHTYIASFISWLHSIFSHLYILYWFTNTFFVNFSSGLQLSIKIEENNVPSINGDRNDFSVICRVIDNKIIAYNFTGPIECNTDTGQCKYTVQWIKLCKFKRKRQINTV